MRELLGARDDFSLADVQPAATPGFVGSKRKGRKRLAADAVTLAELQELLFANSKAAGDERRVLLVLQAMDTAGKGGIVKHVVGAVSPLGVRISAFGRPTEEELAHDFLWRIRKRLPGPGQFGVFDRSHYEDVLIHRVRSLSSPEVVEERYGIINDFEKELVDAGTTVIKVMLHVSSGEQRERLAARLDQPEKHWKFSLSDLEERELWPAYMEAYDIAIRRTSTHWAPWFVVPADHKWYARWAVQRILIEEFRSLDQTWPAADFDVAEARRRLALS